MDLEEIGTNAGNWVHSAQDTDYWRVLVNAALNLRVPYAMEIVRVSYLIFNKNEYHRIGWILVENPLMYI